MQRVQRNFGTTEYLRVFEPHKDNFPHIHILLRLRSFRTVKDSGIFLRNEYFSTFKSLWDYGHTDFQCPRYSNFYPIGYILKYLGKSTSTSRLWATILDPSTCQDRVATNELGYPIKPPKGENVWREVLIKDKSYLLYSTLKIKKIKLCTWSRGFTDTFKNS